MGMTVKHLIDMTSATLRDQEPGHEFTTWGKQLLISYLNEALCEVASLRPDLFVETQKLMLRAGTDQVLPEGVVAILDVGGNVRVGADGVANTTNDIRPADQRVLKRFGKKPCLTHGKGLNGACGNAGDDYTMNNFVPDPFTQGVFRVEPPVPDGARVEVTATVQVSPPTLTIGDYAKDAPVPCTLHAALMDWMLARAYEAEIESEYAARASKTHIDRFYHSVGQGYAAASRMSSGYVLGNTGTGDRASGVPRELRSMRFGG